MNIFSGNNQFVKDYIYALKVMSSNVLESKNVCAVVLGNTGKVEVVHRYDYTPPPLPFLL